MFAENEAGRVLKKKVNNKDLDKDNFNVIDGDDTLEQLIKKAQEYNVAAGNILETIEKKKGI
jgi:hypothetical protein